MMRRHYYTYQTRPWYLTPDYLNLSQPICYHSASCIAFLPFFKHNKLTSSLKTFTYSSKTRMFFPISPYSLHPNFCFPDHLTLLFCILLIFIKVHIIMWNYILSLFVFLFFSLLVSSGFSYENACSPKDFYMCHIKNSSHLST